MPDTAGMDDASPDEPNLPPVSLADLLMSCLAIVAFALALLQLTGIVAPTDRKDVVFMELVMKRSFNNPE